MRLVAAGFANRKADTVFMPVFVMLTDQGQRLSPKKSSTYAPKRIADHADAKGWSSQKWPKQCTAT
jgi:hypothetical protein